MKEFIKIFVSLCGYVGKAFDMEVSPYRDYLRAARKSGSKHPKVGAAVFAALTYAVSFGTAIIIMYALYWAYVWLWAATPQSWW